MTVYLPPPKDYGDYYVCDIECDGFTPTKIHCLCAINVATGDLHDFVGHQEIKRFFAEAPKSATFVFHNGVPFDAPVIRRLLGIELPTERLVDTLVLSYLYNPGLPGGHSIEAWGERFRDPKVEHTDWANYSPAMLERCRQDVRLGKRVFVGLVERMRRIGFSEMSCQIEHQIREVIDEQSKNGWYFDIPGAQSLLARIQGEQAQFEEEIRVLFPPRLELVRTYERRTKANGGEFASYLRHLDEYPKVVDRGSHYDVYDWEEFNIGSSHQRVERLLELGYVAENFTPTGRPKVDEESLLGFAESANLPSVNSMAQWIVLQGRGSMINTWLNHVNFDDSCMHGFIMTCGANTRRMIHSKPNTANIPKAKAKVKYGIESRQLWRARPGRKQVGCDAKGLEMRMFAQYLNNPEATALFIDGDPHLNNTRNLGLPDHMRDLTVKNGFYAYLYGAQDPKLGQTLRPELSGREARDYGKRSREILETGTPGLAKLVGSIQDELKHTGGLLRCIDGGFVRCGASHAALNYKLQSAGAIVMKQAAIMARQEVKKRGIDAMFVGNIHDEIQSDCSAIEAEELGKLKCQAITDAGEHLNFHVPLAGDFKVGDNWAECH